MSRDFWRRTDRLRARSVDEVCFLVVEGRQGYGKTHAIHWWATRNGCPYVRSEHDVDSQTHAASSAQSTWDAHIRPAMSVHAWLVPPSCWLRRGNAQSEASEDYALIIDEADLIARQRALTETLQELGDLTGHPIVLVGNADLASRLDMHLGFSRRIWELVEFRPATI